MKRLLLLVVLALAAQLVLAGPVGAVPPPSNKNVEITSVSCSGGETLTGVRISHAALSSVVHAVGVGNFKVVSFSAIDPVTGQAFTETTNFPKEPNLTCTGTLIDPVFGPIDFVVTGFLNRK